MYPYSFFGIIYLCCRLLSLFQLSKYGGPAWTWDHERRQFYYHFYHESMPDLNHRENAIHLEIGVR